MVVEKTNSVQKKVMQNADVMIKAKGSNWRNLEKPTNETDRTDNSNKLTK